MSAVAPGTDRGAVETRTRAWLEESYLRAMERLGGEGPGSEVYDEQGQPCGLTQYHFQELQRKLKIFRWLDRLEFESFCDIGSGFDVYPYRVHERYRVPAFYSDMVHSMNLPYGGAEFGKLDRAVTMNLGSLPFRDDAFDVVLSSEVLEHLVRPVEAISELCRVARKYVVMTSLEALSVNRWERFLSHLRVDVTQPHVERNFFLADEIEAIFGPGVRHENLIFDGDLPGSAFASPEQSAAAYASIRDADALVAALCKAVSRPAHGLGAMGILIVKPKGDAPIRVPRPGADEEIARWLVRGTAAFHQSGRRLVREMREGRAAFAERDRPIAPELLDKLRCPDCRQGAFATAPGRLDCKNCNAHFDVEWGVPVLYPHGERDPVAARREALERLCGADAARREKVTGVADRLRRNEVPAGPLKRAAWRIDRAWHGRTG